MIELHDWRGSEYKIDELDAKPARAEVKNHPRKLKQQPQASIWLPQFAKPLKWQAKCEGLSPQNISAKPVAGLPLKYTN